LALWLVGEAVAVLIETALQNTIWLRGLNLPWPGLLTAPTPGASVVQNAAGLRWLRGYGTLPHPNTLGGFVLVGLGALVERYLTTGRRAWLGAGALGIVALVLTFSRASWLGAAVMLGAGAWWAWRYARNRWQRYRSVLLVFGAVGLVVLLPLLPLLAVRADFSDQAVSTETRSVQERQLYALASLQMLAGRPVFGIGAGTFVEVLAGLVPPLTRLEPVHNVILLVATETGLLGGLAVLALVFAIARRAWQRRRAASTAEALYALIIAGMFVTGLFDHYWWTAPPGQLAVATVLGLWAASARQVPAHGEVTLDARREALGRLQPHPHEVGADCGV
jgi:O-antigen ligase